MFNQAKARQYIRIPVPQQRVRCTNTITSPSIWQRARAVVSSAIAKVRVIGACVVSFVSKKATGARRALARVARAAMIRRPWVLTRDGSQDAASRAVNWCRTTWRRVIHPFMRIRVAVLGIGAVVVGLAVAPVVTLASLAGCGVALLGLSRLIRRLEVTDHPAARAALRIIEVAAQILCVVAYVAAGAVVIAISAVSAAFAVTEVLELVLRYLDVPLAVSLAALAFFVLTASWGLVAIEAAWLALVYEAKVPAQASRPRSQDRQAIPLIRVDAERAWNGDDTIDIVPGTAETSVADEETQEAMNIDETNEADQVAVRVTKCMGCDLDDASPRFGLGNMTSLCGQCFEYLVEDELIAAADRGEVSAKDVAGAVRSGIAVPAYVVVATGARLRNTRINLDNEAITCRTPARVLSEQDPSRIHWAETGWWFDGRGNRRARRWHGFVSGRIATTVEYQHEKDSRGFYFVVEGDSWTSSCFKTLAGAQDAAADEISDRQRTGVRAVPLTDSEAHTLLASHVERAINAGIKVPADVLPAHMRAYAQDGPS